MTVSQQAMAPVEAKASGLPDRFHLQFVGKIALAIGLLTSVTMVIVVLVLSGGDGVNYRGIIRTFDVSRENLFGAMLISGLVLLATAGYVTWLIVLFSSFRVAGPLFRLARNLELVDAQGPVPVIRIRQDDYLQAEAAAFESCVGRLREHYDDLQSAAAIVDAELNGADQPNPVVVGEGIAQLKQRSHVVRL